LDWKWLRNGYVAKKKDLERLRLPSASLTAGYGQKQPFADYRIANKSHVAVLTLARLAGALDLTVCQANAEGWAKMLSSVIYPPTHRF
jgi:hypothetical protein